MTKVEIDGAEVEVYTAAERDAAVAEARTIVEGEWKPKFETAEQERTRLDGLLTQRSREFTAARTEFTRLSDEQKSKLSETELALYKNQEILAGERDTAAKNAEKQHESAVDAVIRAKVGTDANLFTKVKEMYGLVNLEDVTSEQVVTRVNAAFGALGQTAPDLLAAAGFGGGSFEPPRRGNDTESFADSQRGKDMAQHFGIALTEEEVKKQKNY